MALNSVNVTLNGAESLIAEASGKRSEFGAVRPPVAQGIALRRERYSLTTLSAKHLPPPATFENKIGRVHQAS